MDRPGTAALQRLYPDWRWSIPMFDAVGERWAHRIHRTDEMLVANDRRHFWFVMAFDLTLFVVAVLVWVTWPLTRDHYWLALAGGIFVGLQLGRIAILGYRRAMAYRSGWLRGRSAMVHAMAEAQRRGMSPQEWLEGEVIRDYAVLGFDVEDVHRDLNDEGLD